MSVDFVRLAVIISHPLAALLLIWLFFRQKAWREQSSLMRGEQRSTALVEHESMGDRIAIASVGIVGLAFASNAARGIIDHGDASSYMVPGLHGATGLIGLAMMIYVWNLGRKTKSQKDSGEKFARTKEVHGRISDVMGMLVLLHAFLGFLYLLSIL
jgi:hypothetical protein|tara:strand:- start:50 stop:520 length:471 start_codon:yes stop_codon:yes gene_type:complete